jgi:metal-dependent hydrolase (beta-lactamase superfamily II)
MTDKEIERLSKAVAKMVLSGLLDNKGFSFIDEDEEQELLVDLAQAMTALDYNLQKENYEKCKELQEKIKTIEQKLNKT